MPINYAKMQKDMVAGVRNQMISINPQAQPSDFQEQIAKAVAKGLENNIKIAKIIGTAPAPVSAGIGQGLTVNAKTMVLIGVTTMMGFTGGSQGIALRPMMDGLFTPIEKHLKQAIIQSESGFGGQGSGLTTVTMASLSPLIFAQLPPNIQASMVTSPMGMFFVNAVAAGIAAGLNAAIPAFVPVGSVPPSPGLLIAKVT